MAYEQEYEHDELENYIQIYDQPAKSVQFPYCVLLYRNIYLVFSFIYFCLDTIYAKCENFVPMEGVAFEYQISTDDSKSWFDAVRTCKVRDTNV